MKRNCKIEFMRFVFAICVVMFHINKQIWSNEKLIFADSTWSLFRHGNMGVEFFFLVSGCLMARSIYKLEEQKQLCPTNHIPAMPIGDETLHFLWGKIKLILPFHIIYNCVAILGVVVLRKDITNVTKYILTRIPGFFFLGETGLFDGSSFISVEWYISAMLLMMAIIYPLARRFYASYTHMFGPLSAFFILGYLYMEHGALGGITDWNGFTYYVVLRAFAELTLGMTCFEIYRKMQGMQFTKYQRLLITLAEPICYAFALRYMCSTESYTFDFLCLFSLCIAITLSFSEQGFLSKSKLFQNRLCQFLGTLSLPIYLSQRPAIDFVYYVLPDMKNSTKALLMLALTLIGGITGYAMVLLGKKMLGKA